MVPRIELGLHLDPHEFCVGIRLLVGSRCPLCPSTILDPLGHHAVTCKKGGSVVTNHVLRDYIWVWVRDLSGTESISIV